MKSNHSSRVSEYFANAKGDAAGIDTSELKAELEKRAIDLVFPFEVFHPMAKDFMTYQHRYLDIPRSFVGSCMLAAYSSAIGTAYQVSSGTGSSPLSLWVCMVGISSSGKSLAIEQSFKPLQEIQNEFDREWEQFMGGSNSDEKMKTILFRDVVVATLARTVLPDNPKGVTKMADELLEFINGLNQYSQKEGTDEQFWLSGWGGFPYSGIRANRNKFSIPRVFTNVIGGIQPSIISKLFQKDRATTGFIFRMLFADSEPRIAEPDTLFRMPPELIEIHRKCIRNLYFKLPVTSAYDEPKNFILNHDANRLRDTWRKEKVQRINRMSDPLEKEVHGGILGKMYDYAIRFSALLKAADLSYENEPFHDSVTFDASLMERALKLADYYYQSAWKNFKAANKYVIAPIEVLRYAAYVRSGFTIQKMGDLEYPNVKNSDTRRKRASRELKKMVSTYPNVFRAKEQ